MRALLGLLLCILLLQTQVYALSGGPDYNRGGGIASIVGTYAGVLVEQCDCDGTNVGGSVGIYTVGIAQTGTSTGTMLIFTSGRVYTGTITGIGDTTSGKSEFKGIVEATYNYDLTSFVTNPTTGVTTAVTTAVTATTNGLLDTKIATTRNGARAETLMSGSATLDVSNGAVDNDGNLIIAKEIIYDITGYRQAAAVAAAAAATPL